MTGRPKKVFAVTLVLCLAFVVTGFFLSAPMAAKQVEDITIIPTPPAPAPAASGTMTVSVRVARVIQINGDGTIRSNTHAMIQKGDYALTAISP